MDRRLSGKGPQNRLEGLGDFAKRASGLFVPQKEDERPPDQDKPKRKTHEIKISLGSSHKLSVEARRERRMRNRQWAILRSQVRRRKKHGRQVAVR